MKEDLVVAFLTMGKLSRLIIPFQDGVTFPCNQCEYKATQKQNLLAHIKSVHEGVKYPCQQCGYKATRKNNGYLLLSVEMSRILSRNSYENS